MKPRIEILRIRVVGSKKEPREVVFAPGLNIIHGVSNTGKSHLVTLIDFAFGAKDAPEIPPEGLGYEALLLSIKLAANKTVTLCRLFQGGGIRVVDGVADDWPSKDVGELLSAVHGKGKSLSEYLLKHLKIDGSRVRKNARGETRELSFRDLARLFIVDEIRIQDKVSPIESGQAVSKTAELSVFKFLLTGSDDKKLDAVTPKGDEVTRRQIELELVDNEIQFLTKSIEGAEVEADDLASQEQKLDEAFNSEFSALAELEVPYRDLLVSHRQARRVIQALNEREDEINSLLSRFQLLQEHYSSDIARLTALRESGVLFAVLNTEYCPLCGAASEHHGETSECDANVEDIAASANAEIGKIEFRQAELSETIDRLQSELKDIPSELTKAEQVLASVGGKLQRERPDYQAVQQRVRQISEVRADVQSKRSLFSRLDSYKERRAGLVGKDGGDSTAMIAASELPPSIRVKFEKQVEEVLKEWQFPYGSRVIFDLKTRDLEVEGKPRAANGKGVRAILHAAFSVALARFLDTEANPQPGFLVLDSPLLTYKDPKESPREEDDEKLAKSDLRERVLEDLKNWPSTMQLIIIENVELPEALANSATTTVFSGNIRIGRQGFY